MSITAGTGYVAEFFAGIADFLAKIAKKIKILQKGLGKYKYPWIVPGFGSDLAQVCRGAAFCAQ